MVRIVSVALIVAAVLAAPAARADVEAGLRVYEAGDFQTAYDEWLPLAEAGDAEAQFRIGRLYHFGEGVKQDGPIALSFYGMAAKQGKMDAVNNIGRIYEVGELVRRDFDKAVHLFLQAAYEGNAAAQHNLGRMYMAGRGVERDFAEGYKWFFIANGGGSKMAPRAIQRFRKYVTDEVLIEAKKRMREWIKTHSRDDGATDNQRSSPRMSTNP